MARKSSRTEVSPSATRGPMVLTLVVFLGVVLLAAQARDEAERNPRFWVDAEQVRVSARPAWLPLELAQLLGDDVSFELPGASLVAPEDLESWKATLAVHPWVEEVIAVEPLFPGRAQLRLRLARPVLELEGATLAAGDGRLLGSGEVWLDPPPLKLTGPDQIDARRACAAGAAELLPHRDWLTEMGVEIVEVESLGQAQIRFRSAQGVLLDWGRPLAVSPLPEVDLTVEARINNLEQALRSKPGLVGVSRVELWGERPRLHLANG